MQVQRAAVDLFRHGCMSVIASFRKSTGGRLAFVLGRRSDFYPSNTALKLAEGVRREG